MINSQSPPVRFRLTYQELLEKYGELSIPVRISELEPEDYQVAVGGVPRMMLQLISKPVFSKTRWVALGPGYPSEIDMTDFMFYPVSPEPHTLKLYTRFKEGLYNESHGISSYVISAEDYLAYMNYNFLSANTMLRFRDDTDIYFVNDFQQLLIGNIIGPAAPVVLWYHIPIVPEKLDQKMREFLLRSLEGFDQVIVSTKRDLEGLVRTGRKINVTQIYPYIDPSSLVRPTKSELQETNDKYGIKDDDKVVVVVGRMDPIKSQDVAIKAINNVDAKLVVVGNGSFTSSSLGHDKASVWANHLKGLVKELHLENKVIFTGYASESRLSALYQRADVVVLPSNLEGFGLVVCEGWSFEKPVVVSRGAGASELVIEGGNGYTFTPGDWKELAEKIKLALTNEKTGVLGKETAKQCYVDTALNSLKKVFDNAISMYI
ncbi:glycosyl transferase [Sulfolobales archaeon HS-7]|nr:glycosyl transferase [Sulfolobales archaeon HS-7]